MKIDPFLPFLQESPTAFHAAQSLAKRLSEKGFASFSDKEPWKIEKEKGFIVKEGSALTAFILPKKRAKKALIFASHIDSPMLKLKPKIDDTGFFLDIYGSPLLYTFLGIDLVLCGQVVVEQEGKIEAQLVELDQFPLVCPPLAIHLDREIHNKGFHINKQEHLRPKISLKKSMLIDHLKSLFPKGKILSYDLFLVPAQGPSYVGLDRSMIASKRLDNLSSAYASLIAMQEAVPLEDTMLLSVFYDHEEIGSNTNLGAGSFFFYETLRRLTSHYQFSEEEFYLFKNRSYALSLDVVLGFQEGHEEKYDTKFSPHIGKGVTIKYHANQKYISSPWLEAWIRSCAEKDNLPLQSFCGRNDIPTGSTIGPTFSALMNMATLDLGIPLLGMHAARELIAASDMVQLVALLQSCIKHIEMSL